MQNAELKYTQKEDAFFGVITWSRLAEVCGGYLKKGRGVQVVGRLKQDRWTGPELKKNDHGKDDEAGAAESQTETPHAQVQEQVELEEAAGF